MANGRKRHCAPFSAVTFQVLRCLGGFIVERQWSSTQIDLMVLKPEKPTLFRDGDLAVVTPYARGAVVEVKTSLNGPANSYRVAR